MNKTKSESIYRIDHLPGEEVSPDEIQGIRQSYREFDGSGNLLMEIAFTADEEIADKSVYRYDEKGQIIESLIYGTDDEVLERTETARDENGRIIRELVYYLDGSVDTREFQYNKAGKLTGMQVTDDEGSVEFIEKYFYEGDRPMKIERLQDGRELVFSQEDAYEDGMLSSRKIWSNEDEEEFTLTIQFNASGRRQMETRYNGAGQVIERNVYEEDGDGRVVRITEENVRRKNITEFSYDDEGKMTCQKEVDQHGNLNHEVFRSYDPEGNPLKTTVEVVNKAGGLKQAYSLIFRYEGFQP